MRTKLHRKSIYCRTVERFWKKSLGILAAIAFAVSILPTVSGKITPGKKLGSETRWFLQWTETAPSGTRSEATDAANGQTSGSSEDMPSWRWTTWAVFSLTFFVTVTPLLHCLCSVFLQRFLISPEKRRSPRLDRPKAVAFFIANGLQVGTALFLATIAFHRGHSHLEARSIADIGDVLRLAGEVFLILLIQDTNFYWFHRLAHSNTKIYRRLHADHHVSRYPNAWVLQYQNPVDYFFTTSAPIFWVVLLPIPFSTTAYFIAMVVANFLNIAGHLGYEVSNTFIGLPSFNGWAAYLDPSRKWIAKGFNNVLHHDLHHQTRVKNYSLYFTFWDRIGGTLHPDTDHVANGS